MELAHLYMVLRERLEEALFPVNNQTAYDISTLLNTDECVFIALHCLALYKGQIERLSALRIQCEQHTEVSTPIRYVQMDKTASV